jgi:hypothetical protein
MDMATTDANASTNTGAGAASAATTPPAIASMSPEQRQSRIRELQSDPGVQQAMQLKSARDASWQQMMKMYGNYIMGTSEGKGKKKSGGGKGKSGGKSSDEPENPVALLQSNDPHDKAKGWFMLAVKAGPPDDYQVRQLLSSESQQLQKLNEGQRKLLGSEQELSQSTTQDKIKWQQYLNMDQAKMTPEQKAEFERLNKNPMVNPTAAKLDKKTGGYPGSDGKYHTQWQRPDGSTYETIGESEERKPISETKPIRAWAMDAKGKPYSVEVDPQTNQIKKGTENYDLMPPSGMMDSIKTGEFSYKDADGRLHRALTTTTTSHTPHGGGGAGAGGGKSGTGAGSVSGSGKSANASTSGAPRGDRVITDAVPTGQTKSRADAGGTVLELIPRVKAMIDDPEVRAELGSLPGRVSEFEMRIGNASPKVRELYGTLKSIYSMAGTMHGWRSLKVAEEFEKAYGGLHTDPDALIAGMNAMATSAEAMYEQGYKHPYKSMHANSAPQGASDEVYAAGGTTLIGHIVKGEYVPLPKP